MLPVRAGNLHTEILISRSGSELVTPMGVFGRSKNIPSRQVAFPTDKAPQTTSPEIWAQISKHMQK